MNLFGEVEVGREPCHEVLGGRRLQLQAHLVLDQCEASADLLQASLWHRDHFLEGSGHRLLPTSDIEHRCADGVVRPPLQLSHLVNSLEEGACSVHDARWDVETVCHRSQKGESFHESPVTVGTVALGKLADVETCDGSFGGADESGEAGHSYIKPCFSVLGMDFFHFNSSAGSFYKDEKVATTAEFEIVSSEIPWKKMLKLALSLFFGWFGGWKSNHQMTKKIFFH